MGKIYIHNVPRRRLGRGIKRFLKVSATVAVILAVAIIVIGIRNQNHARQPVTKAQSKVISDSITTFVSPYFQFQDSGKWVLSKGDSTATKFVYVKYRGTLAQQQLSIYVNQVPIPLYLAAGRVLPVRTVNANSFDPTSISESCGKTYPRGALHNVKEVTINQATMLCDPDVSVYSVVLAEAGGNYQIKMRRPGGQPIQFVILYKDSTLDPQPDSLLRIAGSFKAL